MTGSIALATRPAAPASWPMPRAVLFDLDGTLVDSVPDITLAVNELLASEHLPPLEEAQVRRMVGHGIRALVRKVYHAQGIALDIPSLESRTDDMMEIYPRYLTGRTTLMPGVRELVAFFGAGGAKLGLVTNKPQAAAETIVSHFGLRDSFAVVIGDTAGEPLARKPQPDMLLEALRRMGVSLQQAVMIGDSGVDIRAAKAAGVASIAVRGGYSSEPLESFVPDAIVDSMGDIRAYFEPR